MSFPRVCRFMIALKMELENAPHVLVTDADDETMTCFEIHMISANDSITDPYTREELFRIFKPLFDLVDENMIAEPPTCEEILDVLSTLIDDDYFNEPGEKNQ